MRAYSRCSRCSSSCVCAIEVMASSAISSSSSVASSSSSSSSAKIPRRLGGLSSKSTGGVCRSISSTSLSASLSTSGSKCASCISSSLGGLCSSSSRSDCSRRFEYLALLGVTENGRVLRRGTGRQFGFCLVGVHLANDKGVQVNDLAIETAGLIFQGQLFKGAVTLFIVELVDGGQPNFLRYPRTSSHRRNHLSDNNFTTQHHSSSSSNKMNFSVESRTAQNLDKEHFSGIQLGHFGVLCIYVKCQLRRFHTSLLLLLFTTSDQDTGQHFNVWKNVFGTGLSSNKAMLCDCRSNCIIQRSCAGGPWNAVSGGTLQT